MPEIIDNTSPTTQSVTGVTYNGVAMKRIGPGGWTRDYGGSELFSSMFVLVAPATGTHSIVVTVNFTLNGGSGYGAGSAVSFTGADQTVPYGLVQTGASGLTGSTTASVTMSDAGTGDYVIGSAVMHNSTVTQGGSQTAIVTSNGFGIAAAQAFASAYMPQSTGTTISFGQSPAQVWSIIGVAVHASPYTPTRPMPDLGSLTSVGSAVSSNTIASVASSGCSNGLLTYTASYYAGTSPNTDNISSISWNSQALTKLDDNRQTVGSNVFNTEFWYLKNPASATSNLVATFSGTLQEFISSASTYCLVDQTTPFGTVAKGQNSSTVTNLTVAVTSSTSALVQDTIYFDGGVQPNVIPTGSLVSSAVNAVNNSGGASQVKLGAASTTMNWTVTSGSTAYNMLGVGINFGAPPVAPVGSTLGGIIF
jgi:hypothetical protein